MGPCKPRPAPWRWRRWPRPIRCSPGWPRRQTFWPSTDIDPEAVGRRAFEKARVSQNPQDLEAGRYDVVLEPLAVSTMVGFLAYVGFNGRAIVEGRSPFSGRLGQRVTSERVSIYD